MNILPSKRVVTRQIYTRSRRHGSRKHPPQESMKSKQGSVCSNTRVYYFEFTKLKFDSVTPILLPEHIPGTSFEAGIHPGCGNNVSLLTKHKLRKMYSFFIPGRIKWDLCCRLLCHLLPWAFTAFSVYLATLLHLSNTKIILDYTTLNVVYLTEYLLLYLFIDMDIKITHNCYFTALVIQSCVTDLALRRGLVC